jgi:hypothetical protein
MASIYEVALDASDNDLGKIYIAIVKFTGEQSGHAHILCKEAEAAAEAEYKAIADAANSEFALVDEPARQILQAATAGFEEARNKRIAAAKAALEAEREGARAQYELTYRRAEEICAVILRENPNDVEWQDDFESTRQGASRKRDQRFVAADQRYRAEVYEADVEYERMAAPFKKAYSETVQAALEIVSSKVKTAGLARSRKMEQAFDAYEAARKAAGEQDTALRQPVFQEGEGRQNLRVQAFRAVQAAIAEFCQIMADSAAPFKTGIEALDSAAGAADAT